jgi:hypothetical protein
MVTTPFFYVLYFVFSKLPRAKAKMDISWDNQKCPKNGGIITLRRFWPSADSNEKKIFEFQTKYFRLKSHNSEYFGSSGRGEFIIHSIFVISRVASHPFHTPPPPPPAAPHRTAATRRFVTINQASTRNHP